MNKDWKLFWDESEEYVIFKQIDEEGRVVMEFSLQYPDYGRLYYALREWFGDDVTSDASKQR